MPFGKYRKISIHSNATVASSACILNSSRYILQPYQKYEKEAKILNESEKKSFPGLANPLINDTNKNVLSPHSSYKDG